MQAGRLLTGIVQDRVQYVVEARNTSSPDRQTWLLLPRFSARFSLLPRQETFRADRSRLPRDAHLVASPLPTLCPSRQNLPDPSTFASSELDSPRLLGFHCLQTPFIHNSDSCLPAFLYTKVWKLVPLVDLSLVSIDRIRREPCRFDRAMALRNFHQFNSTGTTQHGHLPCHGLVRPRDPSQNVSPTCRMSLAGSLLILS